MGNWLGGGPLLGGGGDGDGGGGGFLAGMSPGGQGIEPFGGGSLLDKTTDASGTAATGAVDTLIADPGNALLGVNADNMGIFEENAAGAKTMSALTLGLGGEGGLFTDVLMPGQGAPGETGQSTPAGGSQGDANRQSASAPLLLLAALAVGVIALIGVLN